MGSCYCFGCLQIRYAYQGCQLERCVCIFGVVGRYVSNVAPGFSISRCHLRRYFKSNVSIVGCIGARRPHFGRQRGVCRGPLLTSPCLLRLSPWRRCEWLRDECLMTFRSSLSYPFRPVLGLPGGDVWGGGVLSQRPLNPDVGEIRDIRAGRWPEVPQSAVLY